MSINAFVDYGFPSGRDFCVQFLSSSEFKAATLREIAPSIASKENKEKIALHIANSLEKGELTTDEVLLSRWVGKFISMSLRVKRSVTKQSQGLWRFYILLHS